MKAIIFILLCFFTSNINAQTTIWQETFDPAPLPSWNLNAITGINDPDANFWQVTDDEGGVLPPGCGVGSNGNKTLHISNNLFGTGAIYNAGGFCGILFCVETHTRAETPNISTIGNTNLTLNFDYIENGDGILDNCIVYYSVNGGTTWVPLNDPVKTNVCASTQGQWATFTYALPTTCNNISNLKIGFNWENNDDGIGTDPSVAINNIKITTPIVTNTAPVAVDDTVNVACNSGYITVFPMLNDYDINATQIIYLDSSTYTGGYASITNNATYNSFDYKPLTNYNGLSYVNYLLCDNGSPKKCDTGTVYFIIAPCNNQPNAVNDIANTNCNTAVVISPKVNDTDPDAGQLLNITGVFAVNNGTAVMLGSTITFTPSSGYSGTTTLKYIVCDNGTPSLCDTALVTITVANVGCNLPPIAFNDVATINCNTTKLINVLNNDTDPNSGSTLTVGGVYNVSNGTVTNTLNTITFTPTTGYSGITTFNYIVCDNGTPSMCDTATVTITVNSAGCNAAPLALDDNITVSCNTTANKNVIANDSEPNAGQTITISSIFNVTNGTATNTISNINFNPTTGFSGVASVSYIVCDNGTPSLCDTAIFLITVNSAGCNAPPYAGNDNSNVPCNQTGSIIVLGNDSDANGNSITVTQIFGNTPNGVASIGPNNIINYIANFCSPGIDTFYYVLCDNGIPSLCDTGRVIVNTPACGCNFPPIANTDTIFTACGILKTKNLATNDTDPNLGTVLTVTSLLNTGGIIGTVTKTGNIVSYTPIAGYSGVQQFNYIVCDNATPSKCDTGLVVIIVTPCNQAPIAFNDNATTTCNASILSSVLNNDTDPDAANTLTAIIFKNPNNGTATITNSVIKYTPNNCYSGNDTVTYIVCDNGVPILCDTAFLFIIIDTCNCAKPIANFTLSDSEICVGECINFFDLSSNNPNAWSWIFDGVVPNTSSLKNPINICYNTPGAYNVSLIASNTFGAGIPIVKTARVIVLPNSPAITVSVTDTIGKILNLNATSAGATNYSWSPTTGLSNALIANPSVMVNANTSYTCNYTIANGCNGTFVININAVPGPIKTNYIWVPNAFSPNGDSDNPVFKAIGNNVSDYELIIYNRWGNKVFSTTDINQGWNGTQNGIDNITQTYFYYLRAIFNDGKVEIKKGDITVIY